MCSVWGNDLCGSGGLLLGSGRGLASRSSLYSFKCAPLAKGQLRPQPRVNTLDGNEWKAR